MLWNVDSRCGMAVHGNGKRSRLDGNGSTYLAELPNLWMSLFKYMLQVHRVPRRFKAIHDKTVLTVSHEEDVLSRLRRSEHSEFF